MELALEKNADGCLRQSRQQWAELVEDENGKRRSKRIGTKQEYPQKAAAWKAVEHIQVKPKTESNGETVSAIAARYGSERLPARFSTARMYRSWLRNHILPRWGTVSVNELQPRDIEFWLRSLALSPKSKAHIRGMLRIIVDFAMWAGVLEISRNPIELVVVKGCTKRTRHSRSLTVEEFHKLNNELKEPCRTMSRIAVCFGLRVSELLALQWRDIDWLNGKLRVERAIVAGALEGCWLGSKRSANRAQDQLSALKLAEREGFEPSIQVLARITV